MCKNHKPLQVTELIFRNNSKGKMQLAFFSEGTKLGVGLQKT